jgi:regulator of RNase E activity RraA
MLNKIKTYFRRRAILALIEGQTLNHSYWTCTRIAEEHRAWYGDLVHQYADQHKVSGVVPFAGRASQTEIKDLDYAAYVYRRQFLIKILTDLK